jgi:hypothetical protein
VRVSARSTAVIALCVVLSGCAHGRQAPRKDLTQADADATAPASQAVYHESARRPPAAALVFAAPITAGNPQLDLSREDRQRSAFVGYPEGVMEFFSVRWDDRQSNWGGSCGSGSGSGWGGGGFGDRYERRAVSEKVGVLFR